MENYIFINSGVVAIAAVAIFLMAAAVIALVAGVFYKDEKLNEECKKRRVAEAEKEAYLNFFTERDLERYKKRFFKNLEEAVLAETTKGRETDG